MVPGMGRWSDSAVRLKDVYAPVDELGQERKPSLQPYPEIPWDQNQSESFKFAPRHVGIRLLKRVAAWLGKRFELFRSSRVAASLRMRFCTSDRIFWRTPSDFAPTKASEWNVWVKGVRGRRAARCLYVHATTILQSNVKRPIVAARHHRRERARHGCPVSANLLPMRRSSIDRGPQGANGLIGMESSRSGQTCGTT